MQLRPHQIDSLVAMQSNTKGQVIVPTGGGKTMCMIEDGYISSRVLLRLL